MKKRHVLTVCLAGLLAATSLAMLGCGDKADKTNPYQDYQTAISTYKSDATLFKTGSIYGVNTDFYFNNFNQKTSSGSKLEDDKNYIILNAVAMNFIEKYYVEIADMQDKDFAGLRSTIQGLNSSFEVVKQDSKNLVNSDSSANYEIYNGFFANYKSSARTFANNAYNAALTLGNFIMNETGVTSQLSEEQCPSTVIRFYVDFQLLKVYDDYRTLLLDSAQGQELDTNGLYNTASSYTSIYSYLYSKDLASSSADERTQMVEFFKYVDGERAKTRKALDNFSLYEFVNGYDGTIDAYLKENEFAEIYYNQIQDYFSGANAYLQQIYSYFASNILA